MKKVFKALLAVILIFVMIFNSRTNTSAVYLYQVISNGDFTTDLSGWTPSLYSYSGGGTWDANVTNSQALLYAYYGNNAQLTQTFPEKLYPLSVGLFYERLLPNTCNSVSISLQNSTSNVFTYVAGGDNWNHNNLNYIDAYVDSTWTNLALSRADLQSAYLQLEFNYYNDSIAIYAGNEFLGNIGFSSPDVVYSSAIMLVAANPCYDGRNAILGHFDDVSFYGLNATQMAAYNGTNYTLIQTQTNTVTQTQTNTVTETQTNTVTETQSNTITETQSNTVTETQNNTVTETQTNTVTETQYQNVTNPGATTTYTVYNTTSIFYGSNSTETKTVNVTETSLGPGGLGGTFIIYSSISGLMILVYSKSRHRS